MSTEGQEPKSICFPSEWHFDVREYPFPLPLLQIDGAKAKYIGPGNSDWEAAAVRTNHPVPETCPFYYYEITVLDEGNLGYIGMGFCGENVNMARLPGWERHSYGYHGDDGNKFSGLAMGGFYGPTYTTHDVVGCYWDQEKRVIGFTRNGIHLGIAFEKVDEKVLYPTVGMRSRNEEIRANFNETPFVVDLEALMQELKETQYI